MAAVPATVQVRASATPPWPGRRDAPRLQSTPSGIGLGKSDGGRSCEVLTVLWVLTQTRVQAGGCGYRTFEHRERREEHLALFRVLTQLLDHLQMPYRIKPRRVRAQSWRRCGRGEPSPGADVEGVSPVPHTRCRPSVCASSTRVSAISHTRSYDSTSRATLSESPDTTCARARVYVCVLVIVRAFVSSCVRAVIVCKGSGGRSHAGVIVLARFAWLVRVRACASDLDEEARHVAPEPLREPAVLGELCAKRLPCATADPRLRQ